MKKLLLLGIVFVVTGAFAFGGGGHGRKSTLYGAGVDAIGVHYGGECESNEEMIDGKCYKKCDMGLERNTDNTCTVCANGNIYLSYMDDPCGTETHKKGDPGVECVSNKDCDDGKYCNFPLSSYTCQLPDESVCTEIGEVINYTHDGNTFLRNTIEVTKLSAENWCKAQNKSLASLEDIWVDKNNLGPYFDEIGICYGDGAERCEGVDWANLQQVFPDYEQFSYLWTKDEYTSCNTFRIRFSNPTIMRYADRWYSEESAMALCK